MSNHVRHKMGSTAWEGTATGLVGRGHECAVIDALLDGASRGRSGALVLRAEAGTGKTSLLRYAADQADEETVLWVTGVQGESDLDFAGLHSLVRPIVTYLRQLPEPQRDAVAAALGLAPSAGADRFLVSAGVLSLLAAAADDRPVLCLVDDAQWLDVPSAASLVFTARRLGAEGLVILFAAREGERRRFEAPGLDEFVLSGLDHESASVLLGRSAPDATPWARERLLSQAAGNPLALLELPAALSEGQLSGREPLPEALPLTARLRAAFVQRIKRLPEPTQTALLVAAGEDSGELRVVHRAAAQLSLPPDALDPAEDIGMIQIRGDTLTFRHPLVGSAVYESAPLGRRQQIHAALAEALAHSDRPDRALWHRAMAAHSGDEEIAAALEVSARQSLHRGGQASAASAFERAAELSESELTRGARLSEAAEAAWEAGQADRARALMRRSPPPTDDRQRVQRLYLSGLIEGRSGWLDSGVRTMRRAVALSTDTSLSLEVLREAGVMAIYGGDYEQVIALGARAAELPCATDTDRFNRAAVAAYGADVAGDHARAAVLSSEAIELAERLDNPTPLAWAAHAAARMGIPGDGLAHANRAVDLARERGRVTTLPLTLQEQAAQLIGRSQFDLAYAAAEEGRRLALDVGQSVLAGWSLWYLAEVDAMRGEEDRVQAHVAGLQALTGSNGTTVVAKFVGRARGLLELGLGRPAEALGHLLVPLATVRPESHPLVVLGMPDAVEAAVRADRLSEVSERFRRYEEWVRAFPNRGRLALLARCRAMVDDPHAEPHYMDAIDHGDALPLLERARTELLYGEWLRRQHRRVDARPHLRSALEAFGQLGVRPWATRARSELRASGETARKRDPSTRDQLTPQELQIARLVSTGKTNPEVAAHLFLSPRTIDYHLRKVFSKLEITSRAELARVDLGEPVAA